MLHTTKKFVRILCTKSDTLLTFHSFNCTYKNVKTWQNDTKLFYIDTTIYKIVSTNKETRSMSQTP